MWDFRCPQLAGWAGSLLPEQPNCQGNQTAPTLMPGKHEGRIKKCDGGSKYE